MTPHEFRDARRNARCPGCGDYGDVHHVVACVKRPRYGEALTAARSSGALAMLDAVVKQSRRRGGVDLVALTKLAEALSK